MKLMQGMPISTPRLLIFITTVLLLLLPTAVRGIDFPPYNPYQPNKWKGTLLRERVVTIVDDPRTIECCEEPEEYSLWSDALIDPYKVDLTEMEGVIIFDLQGYTPPSAKHVTSDFGFRRWRFHYGIDLKVHRGDHVYAAFDGVVRMARRVRSYGNYVVIRHFNGLETLYAHLDRIDVAVGDTIKGGSSIGLGGNTGRSTGYHLHFEVRYLGNPINPNDLFEFKEGAALKNRFFQLTVDNFEYQKEISKIRYWIVRSGDSLSRISARTGISISKLCSLNGINRNSILRIGQRIRYT